MAFFIGLMLLGAGKYVDLHRFLSSQSKGEEMRGSAPEDKGPTGREKA